MFINITNPFIQNWSVLFWVKKWVPSQFLSLIYTPIDYQIREAIQTIKSSHFAINYNTQKVHIIYNSDIQCKTVRPHDIKSIRLGRGVA